MDRSRIRSIALGAIVALGVVGMGAGCALDEAELQGAVDQGAVPQAPVSRIHGRAI